MKCPDGRGPGCAICSMPRVETPPASANHVARSGAWWEYDTSMASPRVRTAVTSRTSGVLKVTVTTSAPKPASTRTDR
jgi:hypothetical protein